MSAFWDASSLIPLCTPEASSLYSEQLIRREPAVVWWGTRVEVAAGLAKGIRIGKIPANDRETAEEVLRQLASSWEEITPSDRVRELAVQNVARFDLRAADAVQLAAALIWCGENPEGRTFVCNDLRLAEAARALGFKVLSYYC